MRELRAARGVTLKQMAGDLGVTSAYLSALEHGHRGRPSFAMVEWLCSYFLLIWDDAEALHRLAQLSHPRVVVDTSGLSPKATELANRLAEGIHELDEAMLDTLLRQIPRRRHPT
jgi:transcriptional regulator with XRE-family HTH domain